MSEARSNGPGWWQQYRVVPRVEQRTVGSRWLYRVDHYSSLPIAAIAVGVLLVAAFVVGIALSFPSGWIVAFESATFTGKTFGNRRTDPGCGAGDEAGLAFEARQPDQSATEVNSLA